MRKYKTGDKVVLRKDLKSGKCYGNWFWSTDKDYMKEKDYVVIERIDIDGHYVVENNGWNITDEMIEGLYKEMKEMKVKVGDKVRVTKVRFCNTIKKGDIVEIDRAVAGMIYAKGHKNIFGWQHCLFEHEFELVEDDKKYIWISENFKLNEKTCFYVLVDYNNTDTATTTVINKGIFHKQLLEGYKKDCLLTKEEAKRSPLFDSFKPIDVVEEKEYFVKLKLPNVDIRDSHSYLTKGNKGIRGNNYITNLNNKETPSKNHLFTKNQAEDLVKNSNGVLYMEKFE